VLRRCVWSRNIENGCSIYIYIYNISRLRVNDMWCCELKNQELGLPCPDDRVLLWPRHSNLASQHLVRPTHYYCDVHFFSCVNNAASVCLSLHMVCAAYICRRQGINYDIPSYFYLISLHTPPSMLLLPHTFVF